MEFLTTLFYFIVTIGILVFVHELGHFLAAKLTGMRVDRFSIGFPPRAFGKRISDTDYCVSWIPIGGYVKIAGMIDESNDLEFLQREPQPWEFRSKSFAARVFVITAGVLMNILLAVGIFWGINYAQGKYLRETTEIGYVIAGSPAAEAGLKAGDRVLTVNGQTIATWDEIQGLVYFDRVNRAVSLEVESAGVRSEVSLDPKGLSEITTERLGFYPAHTAAVVGSVESGKPADQIGLKARDVIVSVAGVLVVNEHQVIQLVRKNADRPVRIAWKRGENTFEDTVTPTSEGRIGITIGSAYVGPTRRIEYSLLEALPEGVSDVVRASVLFYRSIVQLITGKVSFAHSFGGPIKIAQFATRSAEIGFPSFMAFVAILSMSLAFLNILPFPALDGGHLVFLVAEGILRREISNRVKIAVQQAGFIFLLAFMAFVIYTDIANF